MTYSRNASPSRNHSPSRKKDSVSVFCRIRHVSGVTDGHQDHGDGYSSSESEISQEKDNKIACKLIDQQTVCLTLTDKRKDNLENDTNYKFTRAFDPSSTQKEIFDITSRPLVDRLVEGGDGLLFAYGITGSGKTYTMMGSKKTTRRFT